MSKRIVPAKSDLSVVAVVASEETEIDMGVLSNGTAFLTERGLARACGVTVHAIRKHASQLALEGGYLSSAKLAVALKEQGWKGGYLFHNVLIQNVKVYAYPEQACLAFIEYYAFHAGRYCTTQAKDFACKLMRKSFRDFVYAASSYTAPRKEQGYLLGDIVLEAPKKWSLHFSKGWQLEAQRITRWDWQWSCMGGFILEHVYGWLPCEVVASVAAKRKASGNTKKLHQYFSVEVGEVYLRQQIQAVYEVLLNSTDRDDFESRMAKLKKQNMQLIMF